MWTTQIYFIVMGYNNIILKAWQIFSLLVLKRIEFGQSWVSLSCLSGISGCFHNSHLIPQGYLYIPLYLSWDYTGMVESSWDSSFPTVSRYISILWSVRQLLGKVAATDTLCNMTGCDGPQWSSSFPGRRKHSKEGRQDKRQHNPEQDQRKRKIFRIAPQDISITLESSTGLLWQDSVYMRWAKKELNFNWIVQCRSWAGYDTGESLNFLSVLQLSKCLCWWRVHLSLLLFPIFEKQSKPTI